MRPDTFRPLTLVTLGTLSLAVYLAAFVLPYDIFTYINVPLTNLPKIADRRPEPAAVFIIAFLVLFGLYALAYRVCQGRHSQTAVAGVILGGLLMAVALVFAYPLGAGDIFDYALHGEQLAWQHTNPLVRTPAATPGTVFDPYSGFTATTSNYGPLWTWIGAGVSRVVGTESLLANILAFKGVAITAYLAEGVLVYVLLRRRAPAQALAGVLLFAWNPLVLYEVGANGHNDAVMMTLALAGILSWDLGYPLAMVAALTLSLLIKVPTAPLLPLFLLAAVRARPTWRDRLNFLVTGGLLALAIVSIVYAPLPDALPALANLGGRANLFTHSLPALVKLLLQLVIEQTAAELIARTAVLIAFGLFYLWQLRSVWQRPAEALVRAYDVVLFLLLFATLWFQPWYVTWLVPLAALFPRADAPAQAGLFSLTVTWSYIVYGFVWFWIIPFANWGNQLGINLIAVAASFTLPWAYAAWWWWRRSSRKLISR